MKLLEKRKLNILYPELNKINNMDSQVLEDILSNKDFPIQYKKVIKPFKNYLKKQKRLTSEMFNEHLRAVFTLASKGDASKYISYIESNNLAAFPIPNFAVFKDSYLEELRNLRSYETSENLYFSDNIARIINEGHFERLKEFLNYHNDIGLKGINPDLFSDKVWNILKSDNNYIRNSIRLFHSKEQFDFLVDLVNNDLFAGFVYTKNRINSSEKYINNLLRTPNANIHNLIQLSENFIKNIDLIDLEKIYSKGLLDDSNESKVKILQLASLGNYELIRDIIRYDSNIFRSLEEADMKKNFFEIDINEVSNKDKFFYTYFDTNPGDIYYLKLFLEAFSDLDSKEIPYEFKQKYGKLLTLIRDIFNADDDELINISRRIKIEDKVHLWQTLRNFEKDGNELLKRKFARDVKEEYQNTLSNASCKLYLDKNGQPVKKSNGEYLKVYELNGEPFTMLVHAIRDNHGTEHNDFVKTLLNDPKKWNYVFNGNPNLSTSLIFDEYMTCYGEPDNEFTLMFGFAEFSPESLELFDVSDLGIGRKAPATQYNMRNIRNIGFYGREAKVNTITGVDRLKTAIKDYYSNIPVEDRNHCECLLSRIDKETKDVIAPSCTVCMDKVCNVAVKAAQEFNNDIILINRKYYKELPYVPKEDIKSKKK